MGRPKSNPYDPHTYKLLTKEDIIIYKPNVVSRRKYILIGTSPDSPKPPAAATAEGKK